MTDFWRENQCVLWCCQAGMFVLGITILISCQQEVGKPEAEEFLKNIRTTEARSPAEEQAGFTLPAGFSIQLFASEPDIGKPLNMAWDSKGRMWLTQSYEYPFADTTGNPRDKISILEDTNGDGQADVIKTFADSLNIPIGIVAVQDGAIAYSIPNIYHFIDHDEDDQVDERKVLYGGFQYDDTHGMINNLMRSWDGWIHADHGFANTSTVAGTDGDTIVMVSGNTFRFQPDGSRVEFTTTGRVNPYGYAYDELGYTYSTDCHTSPIYQLVRGADYPHFAKKPTGIGFGPALMEHNYGTTALAGLEYCLGAQFPEGYQQSFYLGDVVKSRVYRATMEMEGTTPKITWQEDFIISEDPWFRPVDVKLGPDGALYVADFYNRIIGHYEVPLDHPGRDRQRGRIWRISYDEMDTRVERDWSQASLDELLQHLDHPNLPLRMSLADEIVDRFGHESVSAIRNILDNSVIDFKSYIQGLWIFFRLNTLDSTLLSRSLRHDDEIIRTQARRVLFEMSIVNPVLVKQAVKGLEDLSPHVQRQSVMVAGKHPNTDQIRSLLQLSRQVSVEDTHLAYSIKQGLRDHIRHPEIMRWVRDQSWTNYEQKVLASIMVGDTTPASAWFLTEYVAGSDLSPRLVAPYSKHVASYGHAAALRQLIASLRYRAIDTDTDFDMFRMVEEGIRQSGRSAPREVADWKKDLANRIFTELPEEDLTWQVEPIVHQPFARNPWILIDTTLPRRTDQKTKLLMSGPIGEGYVASKITSPSFLIPPLVTFKLIGVKGPAGANEAPTPPLNRVELIDDSGQVLRHEEITDEWQELNVRWQLSADEVGRQGSLVLTDGSRARGEFIAIGDLDPPLVDLPTQSPGRVADKLVLAIQTAEEQGLAERREIIRRVLMDDHADVFVRSVAARALLTLEDSESLPLIESILTLDSSPLLLMEELALVLAAQGTEAAEQLVLNTFEILPYRRQKEVTLALADSDTGIGKLLQTTADGEINAQYLSELVFRDELAAKLSRKHHALLEQIVSKQAAVIEDRQELIDARLWRYRMEKHSAQEGPGVFATYCASCHELNGEGNLVGPQLDGIGNWGLVGLTEKIIDPNRNISKAFTTYSIRLKDGSTRFGLLKGEEVGKLIFVDATGSEFLIREDEIESQSVSPYSLMPSHFGQIIPEKEYYSLIAYLLNQV